MFIILYVSSLYPLGWERVYPEITGKVSEIKYLSVDDPYSAIFALQADGIGYYKDSMLEKFKYDSLSVGSVEFADSLSNEILCAMSDGSANDGLYKFNKESETFSLIFSSDTPNFVRKLADGRYYFGSNDGLFYSDDCIIWNRIDSLSGKNIFDASYYQYSQNKKLIATDGDKLFYFKNDTLTTYDPDLHISDLYGGFLSLYGGSYSDGIYAINYNDVLDLYCNANNPDKLGWFEDVGLLVICQSENKIYYIKSSESPHLTEIAACTFDYDTIYCSETYPVSEYLLNFIIGTDTGIYKYENVVGIEEDGNEIIDFELSQNYPNPFNSETQIQFSLEEVAEIELSIYNAKGEFVRNLLSSKLNKGKHSFSFKADGINSGLYFYKLSIDGVAKETKKMLYLK
jgi:hypothetical protein